MEFKFIYNPVWDANETLDVKNSNDFITTGSRFTENPDIPITERKMVSQFPNKHVVWTRKAGITENYVEDHGEYIAMFQKLLENVGDYTPATKEEEHQKAKDGAKFIISKGLLGTGFWFATKKLLPALRFTQDKNVDKSTDEFKEAHLLIDTILHGPREAAVTVLKTMTDKEVTIYNNDVAINNKKVSGKTEHTNATGTYQRIGFNVYDYSEFFKKMLSDDEYHRKLSRKGQAGITSLEKEIPNLNVDKFVHEWHEEYRGILHRIDHIID